MKVVRFDHTSACALGDEDVVSSLASVVEVLETTPVPYWRGKSEKQCTKSVLQPVLNAYIEQEMVARGWEAEYRVTGQTDSSTGMRVDFARHVASGMVVVVEVQFGNVGRFYGDLCKFLHLKAEGRLALAVHVSLTDETATLTDSGISTHENSQRRVGEFAGTVLKDVPLICLGLSHQGATIVDFATSRFPHPKVLQGEGAKASISHAVSQMRSGVPIDQVAPPDIIRPLLKSAFSPLQAELLL